MEGLKLLRQLNRMRVGGGILDPTDGDTSDEDSDGDGDDHNGDDFNLDAFLGGPPKKNKKPR